MNMHNSSIVVLTILGIGWCSVILATKQCEQCEDKLDQYRKEMALQQREINVLTSEMQKLQTNMKAMETKPNGGVSYTRWGRTTCPNAAELVYKGKVYHSPLNIDIHSTYY